MLVFYISAQKSLLRAPLPARGLNFSPLRLQLKLCWTSRSLCILQPEKIFDCRIRSSFPISFMQLNFFMFSIACRFFLLFSFTLQAGMSDTLLYIEPRLVNNFQPFDTEARLNST